MPLIRNPRVMIAVAAVVVAAALLFATRKHSAGPAPGNVAIRTTSPAPVAVPPAVVTSESLSVKSRVGAPSANTPSSESPPPNLPLYVQSGVSKTGAPELSPLQRLGPVPVETPPGNRPGTPWHSVPVEEPVSAAFGNLDQNGGLQAGLRAQAEDVKACKRAWIPPREMMNASGWANMTGTFVLNLEAENGGYRVESASVEEARWEDEDFFACLTSRWAGAHVSVAALPDYMRSGNRYRLKFPFHFYKRMFQPAN